MLRKSASFGTLNSNFVSDSSPHLFETGQFRNMGETCGIRVERVSTYVCQSDMQCFKFADDTVFAKSRKSNDDVALLQNDINDLHSTIVSRF